MSTIDEQIAILQAFKEGKTIEIEILDINELKHKWVPLCELDSLENSFDFQNNNYRIKPVQKLRPYKSAKEFLSAQAEHGPYIDTSLNKNCTYYELPLVVVNASGIIVHSGGKQYSEIVEFHWQDGTPCGVLEEE